jgi:hypothetical protein
MARVRVNIATSASSGSGALTPLGVEGGAGDVADGTGGARCAIIADRRLRHVVRHHVVLTHRHHGVVVHLWHGALFVAVAGAQLHAERFRHCTGTEQRQPQQQEHSDESAGVLGHAAQFGEARRISQTAVAGTHACGIYILPVKDIVPAVR